MLKNYHKRGFRWDDEAEKVLDTTSLSKRSRSAAAIVT
jgi:hypothetical protein